MMHDPPVLSRTSPVLSVCVAVLSVSAATFRCEPLVGSMVDMESPAFTLPLVRTRQALLGAGVDDGQIRQALAAGTLVRVRRGCYVDGPLEPAEAARTAVTSKVAAVAARVGGSAVFSHRTAAALWGLPFLGREEADVVHVTVPRDEHGARRAGIHYHLGPLRADEIVEHRGIRLTSLARTLVDVACTEGLRQGVVMADHGLRWSRDPERLRGDVHASIALAGRCSGIGAARQMVAFADPKAESPGESLSRLVFHEQQVPKPQLQYRLVVPLLDGGRGVFRTDFGWEEQRVVGEFDGRAKYERYLADGESPGDAVFREKRREEAICRSDWLVERWTWEELKRPEVLARRIREILAARS